MFFLLYGLAIFGLLTSTVFAGLVLAERGIIFAGRVLEKGASHRQ